MPRGEPMTLTWTDAVGWAATAVFVMSYFFRHPAALRAAQLFGGALWLLFGVMIASMPVIVCNALIVVAAAWTLVRARADVPKDARPVTPREPG